jgi:hypothetical protein
MQDICRVSQSLVASTEPQVVFSSLARSCVPVFSDCCLVELSEGVEELFRVTFPATGDEMPARQNAAREARSDGPRIAGNTLSTPFDAPSALGYPSYAGVVYHSWLGRYPTGENAIVARLLVDLALSRVSQERLAESAARAEQRAAKLALDLITSRGEGEAIGILSAKHNVARQEVLWLLRRVSRETRRELCEVAADVVRAGDLDWPSAPWVGDREPPPVTSVIGRQRRRSRSGAQDERDRPPVLASQDGVGKASCRGSRPRSRRTSTISSPGGT